MGHPTFRCGKPDVVLSSVLVFRRSSAAVAFEVLSAFCKERPVFVAAKPNLVFQPEPAHECLERLFAEDDLRWIWGIILPLLRLGTVEIRLRDHAVIGAARALIQVPEDASLRVGKEAKQKAIG